MKVGDYKIIIACDGMITYQYRWSDGIACHFNLLSEVAESYRPLFKRFTDNMDIATVELDRSPWVADFLFKAKEGKQNWRDKIDM